MRPFYFGQSERALFGIYHPPEGSHPRDAGVVLCHPAPQEYMSSHWALRKLALALTREGFHVLRFDYFGTGDSAGESGQGTLEQWRDDIVTAAEELRDVADVRRVSVVGFRLGATLAALAPLEVRDLVLWDPVADGRAYLEELRQIQRRLFAHCLHPPRPGPRGATRELCGFPLSAEQERATLALRVDQELACRADRLLLVVSDWRAPHAQLRQYLERRAAAGGPRLEVETVGEADPASAGPFLLSSHAQQLIAARLAGRPA